ncbi:MAG: glycosyltransferase family 4 protein [Fibrobacteraceae bacterium]|nr:glycosyltransferase family 4 protein [Fibrobacteraceae bacterium]
MRILVLNYRDRKNPNAGGAELHLHKIFGKLAADGNTVVLLTTAFKGAPHREVVDGITVVRSGSDWAFQLTVARLLKKLDAEFHFDVVYEDLNKLPLLSPFLTKLPKLVQIHHLWRSSIFKEASFPIALFVWLWESAIPILYRKVPFVAVSPSTVKELVDLGISNERVSLVYNGMDPLPADFSPSREKERVFLWLSRVHRYKGIMVALDAFEIFTRRHPDAGFKLRIVGRGPMLSKLPREVEIRGLSGRVIIEGAVDHACKLDFLSRAFCLLQTSYKEGWGLTVIEAATCGTTSIASNVPGLCDSVKDGVTGLLFEVEKGAENCALLMDRIYADERLKKALEINAKRYAESFSWNRAAEETLAILQRTIAQK